MSRKALIHLGKSGCEFTSNDLVAYHIDHLRNDPENGREFFGRPPRPFEDLDLDPHFLTPIDEPIPDDCAPDIRRFLSTLCLAKQANSLGEGVVDTFSHEVLMALKYDLLAGRGTALGERIQISLNICGEKHKAVADTYFLHLDSMILLIVQENKTPKNKHCPKAQVIAEAIAAFQHNNERRAILGRRPLESMIIPCITMVRTRPTFYKVPVTRALSEAVIAGEYPNDPTIVTSCTPPSPSPDPSVGMDNLEYRATALSYYVAFRDLAQECWTQFLSD